MEPDQSSVHGPLWHNIKTVLLHKRAEGGEAGIHARVDAALSVINCNEAMTFIRDNITASTTKGSRPDACLTIHSFPPLVLVEEKTDSTNSGSDDLKKKFWRIPDYMRLPFVIGIAIEDDYVTIYRMSSDQDSETQEGLLSEFPAGRLNLLLVEERIRFIQILINLGRYCAAICKAPQRYMAVIGQTCFLPIKRHNSTVIKNLRDVTKVFKEERAEDEAWVATMIKFYSDMQGVRYLERCIHVSTGKRDANGSPIVSFLLRPVGVPMDVNGPLDKALHAVAFRCIAQALAEIHKRGWAHNDVRWPNVVLVYQGKTPAFVLIDCEYAWPLKERYQYLHKSMEDFGITDKSICSVDYDVRCFEELFTFPPTSIQELHSQLKNKTATLAQVASMVTVGVNAP